MEPKRIKPKSNKFPESTLAFYIKLYCKQKGSSKTKYQSNLVEATKSWLSLSEAQKQQVNVTYKKKEHMFNLRCFDQLKNAEPFMKVKDPIGLKNVDLKSSSAVIQEPEVHIEEVRLQAETAHTNQIEYEEDIKYCEAELVIDVGAEHDREEHNEAISEPIHTNEETSRPFLVEPLPPTLRTSKDLFHMLNPSNTDGANSISWTALPTFEKNQYRRAVSLLKKDYITKYKEYLESLTPKELFDYYIKTMNKMLF